MKDVFAEYYSPSPEDLKRFITEATIVLDANVLLALYEFSSDQRAQVLGVLGEVANRLWVPYQAGFEYQSGRMRVVRRLAGTHTSLHRLPGGRTTEEMRTELRKLALDPDIAGEVEPLFQDVAERLSEALSNYRAEIDRITARHIVTEEQAMTADPVREELDRLLEGKIGKRPSPTQRDQWIKEADKRYAAEIPPGFKDNKKESPDGRAGDYLLWRELLEHAKEVGDAAPPCLLVTQDEKEDWFERSGGKVVGPRPELLREFSDYSAAGYYQVTLARFLELANDYLSTKVDDQTIERAAQRTDALDIAWPSDHARRVLHGAVLESLNSSDRERVIDNLLNWGGLNDAAAKRLAEAANPAIRDTSDKWRELTENFLLTDLSPNEISRIVAIEALRRAREGTAEPQSPDAADPPSDQ